MHVSDDFAIVEPVDDRGRAVPPGARAAKVYLTNLINPAQPLIRYELTDELTMLEEPCPCGSRFTRVADIQGRLDDVLHYCELVVHPHVLRSVLGRASEVVEYQVRQTPRGVRVLVRRADDAVPVAALTAGLAGALERAGLADPEVAVEVVDALPRQMSGKLQRFVTLDAVVDRK